MIRFDDEHREIVISVRTLVERLWQNAARVGSGWSLTPEHSMRVGRRIHADWQRQQAEETRGFEYEKAIERQVAEGEWTVLVRGRVDGLSQEGDCRVVEEVKSTAQPSAALLSARPSAWPEYETQLQVYLWLLAGECVSGRLTMISVLDGSRHSWGVELDPDFDRKIREEFNATVLERERLLRWRESRKSAAVVWPYGEFRSGQREAAERLRLLVARGGGIALEGPTGAGKTDVALWSVLSEAILARKQVFWATARTTHQQGVESALQRLRASFPDLRSVTLGSRRRSCLKEAMDCRPDRCDFAHEFRRRIRATHPWSCSSVRDWSNLAQREWGSHSKLCPHDAALDLCSEADVVVGDYYHLLEAQHRFLMEQPKEWIVVVDEIHQLPGRQRESRSPTLTLDKLLAARTETREACFEELLRDIQEEFRLACRGTSDPAATDGWRRTEVASLRWRELALRFEDLFLDHLRGRGPDWVPEQDAWLALGRDLEAFSRELAAVGATSVVVARGESELAIWCLDPSAALTERMSQFHAMVGLSATLQPISRLTTDLGFPLEVVSLGYVFPAENTQTILVSRVSTAWKDRESQLVTTARLMERCLEATPGSAAVYFPSFDTLHHVTSCWQILRRSVFRQAPEMSDQERAACLEAFLATPNAVFCGVLGGIFAEGVDFPPGALQAVLVYGPGYPPVGLRTALLSDHYETKLGRGYFYAATVPGIVRVVQAAGRLHRQATDRGVMLLFDRRFRWREITELFPTHWRVQVPEDPVVAVSDFWRARE